MKAFLPNGTTCEVEITGERKIYRDGLEIDYSALPAYEKNVVDALEDRVYDMPIYVGGYIRDEYRGYVSLVPARLSGGWVENSEGHVFAPDEWDAIVETMDDEIREGIHEEISPCTNQEFFTAYVTAHEAKYGAQWELDKANPAW